jgi:hypothetical protein
MSAAGGGKSGPGPSQDQRSQIEAQSSIGHSTIYPSGPQMGFGMPPAEQQMPSFGGGGKSTPSPWTPSPWTPSPWTPRFNPTQPNPIGPIGQQPVNPPMNQPIRQRSGTGGPILNNRLPQLQPGAAPVPPSTPMPTPGMPGGKSYGPNGDVIIDAGGGKPGFDNPVYMKNFRAYEQQMYDAGVRTGPGIDPGDVGNGALPFDYQYGDEDGGGDFNQISGESPRDANGNYYGN